MNTIDRVLVTGATGLLGSYLLPLMKEKFTVYVLSRSQPAVPEPNVQYLLHNLDTDLETDTLPQTDAIIYLAQSEHFRDFPGRALEVFKVNTVQVLKLLDFARKTGVKKFIYASTGGVYGNSSEPVSDLKAVVAESGIGFYAATKLSAEMLAGCYSSIFPVISLRFFFIYGRGQKSGMLVPRLINNVKSGTPVTLQGTDGLSINPIHASDAAMAVIAVLENWGTSDSINIAGLETVSLRRMCEIIGEKTGTPPLFAVDQKMKPNILVADITKMKTFYKPRILFEEGVGDMI